MDDTPAVRKIKADLNEYIEQITSSAEGLEALIKGATVPDNGITHLLVYYLTTAKEIDWNVVSVISRYSNYDVSTRAMETFIPLHSLCERFSFALVFGQIYLIAHYERVMRLLMYIRDGDV